MSVILDEDNSDILKRIEAKVDENAKVLHSMRRSARIAHIFAVLYWIIILGIGVGSFYYIQPYIDSIMKVYGQAKDTEQRFANFPKSFSDIQDYFKK